MSRPISADEFESLYRATVRDLIGYMRRRGSMDAENAVAEVYAIAWRRRSDLPSALVRRAWLFGTAAKVLQSERRQHTREQHAGEELVMGPASPAPYGDSLTTTTMAAAMDRLPADKREILRLVEWERLTVAELAVALGVRPGTARVRLHRARMALAADPEVRALVDERTRVHT